MQGLFQALRLKILVRGQQQLEIDIEPEIRRIDGLGDAGTVDIKRLMDVLAVIGVRYLKMFPYKRFCHVLGGYRYPAHRLVRG